MEKNVILQIGIKVMRIARGAKFKNEIFETFAPPATVASDNF